MGSYYLVFILNIVAIVVLFGYSLYLLSKEGRTIFYPNLAQPVLFCLLYFLIYSIYGREYYSFDGEPAWFDWIWFTLVHLFRAVDVLDIMEEFGFEMQTIKHVGKLVPIAIMAMHWVVDIFLLSLLWQVVARNFQQNTHTFFKALDNKIVVATVRMLFALALFFTIGEAAKAQGKDFIWFIWTFGLVWPLDNIIRLVDIGDTFYLYDIKLHGVESTLWTGFLGILFRILVAIPVAQFVNRLHFEYLAGAFKTTEELILELGNDATCGVARNTLTNLGSSAIPALLCATADANKGIRNNAVEIVCAISPKEIASVCREHPDIQAIIKDMQPALTSQEWYVRKNVVNIFSYMGAIAKPAIPEILYRLVDEDEDVRTAALQALSSIDAQWPSAKETQAAFLSLSQRIPTSMSDPKLPELLATLDAPTKKALANLVRAITELRILQSTQDINLVLYGVVRSLLNFAPQDRQNIVTRMRMLTADPKAVVLVLIDLFKKTILKPLPKSKPPSPVSISSPQSDIVVYWHKFESFVKTNKLLVRYATYVLFVLLTAYMAYDIPATAARKEQKQIADAKAQEIAYQELINRIKAEDERNKQAEEEQKAATVSKLLEQTAEYREKIGPIDEKIRGAENARLDKQTECDKIRSANELQIAERVRIAEQWAVGQEMEQAQQDIATMKQASEEQSKECQAELSTLQKTEQELRDQKDAAIRELESQQSKR